MAHQHGNMNADDHQKVFDGFVTFMRRAAIATAVFLVFLALAGA